MNKQCQPFSFIPSRSANGGFTLIEISIVLIIVGILVTPLLQFYTIYKVGEEFRQTYENINKSASAMALFLRRYPCPSDRSLPPSDPNYGLEKCDGIPECSVTIPPPPSATGYSLDNSICFIRLPVGTDKDGDGADDRLLVGGLPARYYPSYTASPTPLAPIYDVSDSSTYPQPIPGMRASYMIDGWGNKLTYVVPDTLANPRKKNVHNDYRYGIISAKNEHGNPTAGVQDNGQFAIISHGKNGLGSFTISGERNPCGSGTLESENCDVLDTKFIQALGMYEGGSAEYYDDISYFYMRSPTDLWYSLSSPLGGTSPHINNRNLSNVGFNTDSPTTKLDVDGRIDATTIRTDSICAKDGANCISPTLFNSVPTLNNGTTPTPICGSGKIVTQIANGQATCDYPVPTATSTVSVNCSAGYLVKSVLTNGCIVCINETNAEETKCP